MPSTAEILGPNGRIAAWLPNYEHRPEQLAMAEAVSNAIRHQRHLIVEAGTGVGKTLGYLAPASLWAEKNEAPVWISTYTRNLQHQIDDELDRLFPNPAVKANRVVVRKGRENYLCLLNFEEAVRGVDGVDEIANELEVSWP